jgi:hypothetical protein
VTSRGPTSVRWTAQEGPTLKLEGNNLLESIRDDADPQLVRVFRSDWGFIVRHPREICRPIYEISKFQYTAKDNGAGT